MSWYWSIITILLALTAGVIGGWKLRAWRGQAELREELVQARAHAAALETQVQNDIAGLQIGLLASIDKLTADQRAENERLLHAVRDACADLEYLRARLAESREAPAPEAHQGFAATLPMSNL